MTEKRRDVSRAGADVVHLPKRKAQKSLREQISEDIGETIAAHFREQNEITRATNAGLSAQVQRLMMGIDRLIGEMDGVRTGDKTEAFARVGSVDSPVDLPTVAAESALFYTHTAGEIGEYLGGLRASQVGLLLSRRGLGWAGNGDHQEISRHKKEGQTKFWHREVPARLKAILDEGLPTKYGITNKAVLTTFRKWQDALGRTNSLAKIPTDGTAH